ncbi:TPA: hypothetical protein SLZ58_000771 [Vibrio cholerae]|nr:hypothetical protein [Vibrio cholerae]
MAMNIEQRLEQSAKSIEQSSQKAHDFAEKDTTLQTCAGSRDSLPKVSRIWQENFARQMNQQATEFQDRFALSQQSLPWQAGITISDSLQRYHVGVQGEDGYKEFLPNPLKLPFETSATLADDLTQDRWLENGVPNKHWTESKVTSALEKSLGVNARIWPKDRDLVVGDVIPAPEDTADGLPITHVIVDGNAYAMSPLASGLVTNLTDASATIGGVTIEIYPVNKSRIHPVTGAVRSAMDVVNRSLRLSDMDGAFGTPSEQTAAINNAFAIAVSLFYGELFVDGQFEYVGVLTLPEGLVMRGRNYQTYGEFYRSNPSKITLSGVNEDEWSIVFPEGARPITVTDVDFEGDWLMNGIQFKGSNREVILDRVSIKKFKDCFETNGMWSSRITSLRLTGRGNLFSWLKGGTAITLENIVAQGDKENGIKAQSLYRFGGSADTPGFNFLNTLNTGALAGQYAMIGCEMTGDCQANHSSFDLEEIDDALFYLHDTNQCSVVIDSPYLGATDSTTSFFKFRGKIGKNTSIELKNPQMLERFWFNPATNGPDWRSTLFIDNNATFEQGCRFIVPERFLEIGQKYMTNKAPVVQGFLRANRETPINCGDGLILSGKTQYVIDSVHLRNLYAARTFYNHEASEIEISGTKDSIFGNGLTFKIYSMRLGSDKYNQRTTFSLRSAGAVADRYFVPSIELPSSADIAAGRLPIDISYNPNTDQITVNSTFTTQEFVITTSI